MGIIKGATEEQIAYVVAHLNDRPRRAVAKAAGITVRVLYHIVHKYGGDVSKRNKFNLAAREIVIAEYPNMSSREISVKYGLCRTTILRWANRLNLQHTPETLQRLKHKTAEAQKKAFTKEVYDKIHATRARIYKMERLRVMSGLPQKTKLHVSITPKRTLIAIRRLCDKYNYFTDESTGGVYTLYYDEETRRTPKEDFYSKRHGLTFRQA